MRNRHVDFRIKHINWGKWDDKSVATICFDYDPILKILEDSYSCCYVDLGLLLL